MAELFAARRWVVDKVGNGGDEASKDEILQSNARSRRNGSQDRDG